VKLYWLSGLPLLAAALTALIRRHRAVAIGLSLITLVACARLALLFPVGESVIFLQQQWLMDPATRALLAFVYASTAIVLMLAAFTPQATSVTAPILASVGLLSAAILLRPLALSMLFLPVGLLVAVLAVSPAVLSVARGASRFLAYVATPVPFVLAIFLLLEHLALYPDEIALAEQAAWLVLPVALVWLNLFPFAGMMRVWSRDELSLAAVFLWIVKDAIVTYLLLALWHEHPALQTQGVLAALRVSGLATAVFAGVWALRRPRPSAVLASAAMSELGIAAQGLSLNSSSAALSGLVLLVSRSAAILLATSGLIAMRPAAASDAQPSPRSAIWLRWIPWVAFGAGVLSMAGVPPLGGFLARQQIYAAWQPQEPYLRLAWLLSSAGIIVGLARTFWNLRQTSLPAPSRPQEYLPFLLAACLFLLCLWIGFRPQAVSGLVSGLFHNLLPVSPAL
jgi:formate hydrogenlyase subunit 3/multisubunit Na+/H+ antiporter MnhD subunit